MMKTPIPTLKKQLLGLRTSLRAAEKRYEEAEVAMRQKAGAPHNERVHAEEKLHAIQRDIDRTCRAIRAVEDELIGDWKPKARVEG